MFLNHPVHGHKMAIKLSVAITMGRARKMVRDASWVGMHDSRDQYGKQQETITFLGRPGHTAVRSLRS